MRRDLAERRRALGLTQQGVAELARVPMSSYQRIEAGKTRPRVDQAQRVARVLDTTVAELWPEPQEER